NPRKLKFSYKNSPKRMEQMLGDKFSLKADLIIGIGDLSNLTGVSARQLRYWEEKKYIESVTDGKSSARKYKFEMFYKVRAIKLLLDEGLTLAKAAEQAEQQRQKVEICKKFVNAVFTDVVIEDPEKVLGKIMMGYLDEDQKRKVVGIVAEGRSYIEVQTKK
ncbi:MAG: MerR family transcriptional regulator, partial [Liquorilactobacillus satsumensis]